MKKTRNKKKREPWQTIIRQSQSIANMFTNLDTILPKTVPDFRECNVENILNDITREVEEMNYNSQTKIMKLYSGNIPVIKAIPELIRKMLENVIQNAVESLPDQKGEVQVLMTAIKDSNQIIVRIIDTGVGVKEKDKIFQPFYTTKPDRLGLGLFISKWVTDIHRGEIKLEPHKDIGTTVTIILPIINN